MRSQRIMRHQLFSHLRGKLVGESPVHVDAFQFLVFRGLVSQQFTFLPFQISLFGIGL